MKAAHEVIQHAVEVLSLEKPATEKAAAAESKTDETKKNDDNKNQGGTPPPPPGTPPGGPSDGSSPGTGGNNTPGSFRAGPSGKVDSAMDGVVMGMASDSELAKSQTFSGSTLSHDVAKLSDLAGSNPSGGRVDPTLLVNTVKTAVIQSDYFKQQSPEVQRQMTERMQNYFESYFERSPNAPPGDSTAGFRQGPGEGPTGGQAGGGSEGGPARGNDTFNIGGNRGDSQPNRISGMPDGGVFKGNDTSGRGANPFTGGDSFKGRLEDTVSVNPQDVAAIIRDQNLRSASPQELRSIYEFVSKIKQDYTSFVAAHSGSDSGYFGSSRTIQNFDYVKDNVGHTGSIVFTPVDANGSAPGGVHVHSGVENFLHLSNVVIKDDPTGSGNVAFTPPSNSGTVEVPTS